MARVEYIFPAVLKTGNVVYTRIQTKESALRVSVAIGIVAAHMFITIYFAVRIRFHDRPESGLHGASGRDFAFASHH